jgi:hypothetical protein
VPTQRRFAWSPTTDSRAHVRDRDRVLSDMRSAARVTTGQPCEHSTDRILPEMQVAFDRTGKSLPQPALRGRGGGNTAHSRWLLDASTRQVDRLATPVSNSNGPTPSSHGFRPASLGEPERWMCRYAKPHEHAGQNQDSSCS